AESARLMDLSSCLVCPGQRLRQLRFQIELLLQVLLGGFHPRVHHQAERLSVALAVDGEAKLIVSWNRRRTFGFARHASPEHRRHAVALGGKRRRGVAEIPDEPVHPAGGRKLFRWTEPIGRERRRRGRRRRFIAAGERAYGLTAAVQDFKLYLS